MATAPASSRMTRGVSARTALPRGSILLLNLSKCRSASSPSFSCNRKQVSFMISKICRSGLGLFGDNLAHRFGPDSKRFTEEKRGAQERPARSKNNNLSLRVAAASCTVVCLCGVALVILVCLGFDRKCAGTISTTAGSSTSKAESGGLRILVQERLPSEVAK